jgi:hypothetical protein
MDLAPHPSTKLNVFPSDRVHMHRRPEHMLAILWLGLAVVSSLPSATVSMESPLAAPASPRHVLVTPYPVLRQGKPVESEFLRTWNHVIAQNLDPGISTVEITLVASVMFGDLGVFGIAYAGTRTEGTPISGIAVLLADKAPTDDPAIPAVYATPALARWASKPEAYENPDMEKGPPNSDVFRPDSQGGVQRTNMVKSVHEMLVDWQEQASARLRDARYIACMDAYEKARLQIRLHLVAKTRDLSQFGSLEEIRACREMVQQAREANTNWLNLVTAPNGLPDKLARQSGYADEVVQMRHLDAEYFDRLDDLLDLAQREFGTISRKNSSTPGLLRPPADTTFVFQNPDAMIEYRGIMSEIQRIADAQRSIDKPAGSFELKSAGFALLIQQAAKARQSAQPALQLAADISLLESKDQAVTAQRELVASEEALEKLRRNLDHLLETKAMPLLTDGERFQYRNCLNAVLMAEMQCFSYARQILQIAVSKWRQWTIASNPPVNESSSPLSRPALSFNAPDAQTAYALLRTSIDDAATECSRNMETLALLDQKMRDRAQSMKQP